jgi:hypothetical protein
LKQSCVAVDGIVGVLSVNAAVKAPVVELAISRESPVPPGPPEVSCV